MTSLTNEHDVDPKTPEPRSAAKLASDVARHGSNLLQQEVELAKAEMSEKMSQLKIAVGEIIAGTVLVMVSLGILLAALVSGVARLLMGLFGGDAAVTSVDGLGAQQVQMVALINENIETARALSAYEGIAALLVGLGFAVVGALLLKNGIEKLDPENLVPERTLRQVKKDSDVVRDQV